MVEEKVCVWFRLPTGAVHHGSPLPRSHAQAAVEMGNRKYPDIHHWVAPAPEGGRGARAGGRGVSHPYESVCGDLWRITRQFAAGTMTAESLLTELDAMSQRLRLRLATESEGCVHGTLAGKRCGAKVVAGSLRCKEHFGA